MATAEELLEQLQKSTKNTSKVTETAGKVMSSTFDLAGGAAGKLKEGFEFLKNEVQQNLNAFRDLSKTGASFSNDVVGMTVAAKGMRLEFKDFNEIIGKNAANFAGLGGNVTRGAEQFAKLSKDLMDSKFVDELRQAGFTNKELNEVLALQVSFGKTAMRDDKKSREEQIKGAADLAREMDLMAKLTGKSREAQMEEAKKLQTDQQFQAKLRMLTQGKTDDEARVIRLNAIKQFQEAESRGFGDAFKEIFATGTVQTKNTAIQSSMFQEQFAATRKQALAAQLGDEKAASAAAKEARVAAAKDFNDVNKNSILALGAATGPLFDISAKTYNAQQTFNEGIEATAKKFGMSMKTEEEREAVRKKMEDEAKKAQAGRDEEGKQVSGATKAMINLGSRAGDAEAALFNKLIKPLNEKIGPGLNNFADGPLGAVTKKGKTFTKAVEDVIEQGYNEGGKPKTGGERGMIERERDTGLGLTGSAIREISGQVKELGDFTASGVAAANQAYANDGTAARRARQARQATPTENAPTENRGGERGMLERQRRDLGTLGMTGQLWETPGLKEIGPSVKETILTEGQLMNMIKGINTTSVSDTVSKTMQATQKYSGTMQDSKTKLDTSGLSQVFKEMFLTGQTMSKEASTQAATLGKNQFDSMLKLSSMGNIDSKIKVSPSDNIKSLMPASNELKAAMMATMNATQEYAKKSTVMSAEETDKARQEAMKTQAANLEANNQSGKELKMKPDTATLSDVVASLNSLNSKLSQLLDVQVDIGTKQIRATKSNSRNLFERS